MNTRYDDDAAFCTVSLVPVAVADTSVGWKDACRRSLSVRTLRRGGFSLERACCDGLGRVRASATGYSGG